LLVSPLRPFFPPKSPFPEISQTEPGRTWGVLRTDPPQLRHPSWSPYSPFPSLFSVSPMRSFFKKSVPAYVQRIIFSPRADVRNRWRNSPLSFSGPSFSFPPLFLIFLLQIFSSPPASEWCTGRDVDRRCSLNLYPFPPSRPPFFDFFLSLIPGRFLPPPHLRTWSGPERCNKGSVRLRVRFRVDPFIPCFFP